MNIGVRNSKYNRVNDAPQNDDQYNAAQQALHRNDLRLIDGRSFRGRIDINEKK